jgi:biopolymer transport protein TolR
MASVLSKVGGRKKPMADINVVPYIDVMLVLLIVFMVTAPLLTQGVKVELPKATSEPMQPLEDPIVISVKADGTYYVNLGDEKSKAVSVEDVQDQVNKILAQKPKIPVLIQGDDRVNYGAVVKLMAALQKAGTQQVGLITESPLTTDAT